MKSKVETLGRIRKEFPPRGNLQLFQPTAFAYSMRKIEVASAKVGVDLQTAALQRRRMTQAGRLTSHKKEGCK